VGVTQYLNPDQEADDVMASLAEHFKGQGGHTVLYTNDRDLLQMVEDGKITVHKPKVGMSQEVLYDEEKVKGYFGVPPKLLVCYRSFDGDSSDNLSGVSRVPRKLIATLVEKYGSVQGVYGSLASEKLTEFQRGSLLEGKGLVERNSVLMALDRNLDSVGEIQPAPNVEAADKLLGKYEIKSYTGEALTEVFGTIQAVRTGVMEPLKLETFSLF
jgi:5'-3' exonuclease